MGAVAEGTAPGWMAGAAEVDATPPVGVRLAGYAGRKGASTHVIAPLSAQALVLTGGGRRCALVTVDVIGVSAALVAAVRQRVAESTGIGPEAVLVAASHTHAGPSGPSLADPGDDPSVAGFADRLAGAVRAAAGALQPARLSFGSGRCASVQMNRRDVEGPVDPQVAVLRVESADGRLMAAVVNFACHPTVLSPSQLGISPDYPGTLRATVRDCCGRGAVVMFAQGACADINPVKLTETEAETRRVGTIVGSHAVAVLEQLREAHGQPVVSTPAFEVPGQLTGWGAAPKAMPEGHIALDIPSIAASVREVVLGTRAIPEPQEIDARLQRVRDLMPRLQVGHDERRRQRFLMMRLQYERDRGARPAGQRRLQVQALCLGSRLVLMTGPGEVFVETGRRLKDAVAAAGGSAIYVGYAGGYEGYIPTDSAFDWHGYEVAVSPYDRGAEPAIVRATVEACSEALGRSVAVA